MKFLLFIFFLILCFVFLFFPKDLQIYFNSFLMIDNTDLRSKSLLNQLIDFIVINNRFIGTILFGSLSFSCLYYLKRLMATFAYLIFILIVVIYVPSNDQMENSYQIVLIAFCLFLSILLYASQRKEVGMDIQENLND